MQLTGPWPIHLAQELLEQRKCSKCLFFSSFWMLPSNLAEHFSPEGSMPAPSISYTGLMPSSWHELCIPAPKGECVGRLKSWRGVDMLFHDVAGLWPCRWTAPCLPPSGKNCPPYCTNLRYCSVTLAHRWSKHTNAIHILYRDGTEHRSLAREVRTCFSFAKHAIKYLF